MELKVGSLFAGIGGFELAATWAGIKPIWSNEIDPYCCKVLRKNFNHEIIEKDIRQITKDSERIRCNGSKRQEKSSNGGFGKSSSGDNGGIYKLKPVDILTGGFPCQPFSHAGKRKGTDDNRYLWPEYLRLIRELQPSWVIAENVVGLVSMENGRTLEGILNDLENENYQTEVYNIPACGVGAWHKRERIWIVSHARYTGQKRGNEKQFQGGNKSRAKSSSCDIQPRKVYKDVSDSDSKRLQRCEKKGNIKESRKNGNQFIARHNRTGRPIWDIEPNVGRVANGIPRRVDRLKGLGNAIVPQVAYEIFKAINQTALWN